LAASEIFWLKNVLPTGKIFQTQYRNSKLTLARFSHIGEGARLFEAEAADAFVAIIPIGKQLAHQSNFADAQPNPASVSDNFFNFADLNAGPQCAINGPLDNFHLHIPREALDELAEEMDSPHIERLHSPDGWETTDSIVENIKQTLIATTTNPSYVSQLFIDHMILALHAHLASAYGGLRENQRRRIGVLATWQVQRAKGLIAANLSGELSLREIANECKLSIAHFARAFKASTGFTPHEWLQSCRVQCAEDLMLTSDLPLADIALQCGFADQSHFTKVFARIAGDTPGAWRRFRWAA
jgi:AraC family transcriptional regulator